MANDGSPVIQLCRCARSDRSNEQLDLPMLGERRLAEPAAVAAFGLPRDFN